VVLMEFPSMADARNWYNSPEYWRAFLRRVRSGAHDVLEIGL